MDFTLKILGTASAMPISDKNPSAQVLQVHGRLFLIDCGEGAQQKMRQMHLSFLKIEAIFLSHIHGDHIFGIFGLLSTMGMYGRSAELPIYAPSSFGPILKFFLSYFGEGVNFPITHHVLDMKDIRTVHESKCVKVSAFPLQHKIDCYGFRFDEVCSARQLEKRGPCSYAYCSDTMYFPQLAQYVKGVKLLYHEATYLKDMADKAQMRFHSTTHDAAKTALDAEAGKLVIAHYTSRERDLSLFENECREIFAQSYAAHDGDIFEID